MTAKAAHTSLTFQKENEPFFTEDPNTSDGVHPPFPGMKSRGY